MKHMVTLTDEQLDKLLEEFQDANPITNERDFAIMLALQELEDYRAAGPLKQVIELTRADADREAVEDEMVEEEDEQI